MGRAVTCTTKWTGPCRFWGEWHHCAHASLGHDGDHGCECGEDTPNLTDDDGLNGLRQRLIDWGIHR